MKLQASSNYFRARIRRSKAIPARAGPTATILQQSSNGNPLHEERQQHSQGCDKFEQNAPIIRKSGCVGARSKS
jgi:hypothetical protein